MVNKYGHITQATCTSLDFQYDSCLINRSFHQSCYDMALKQFTTFTLTLTLIVLALALFLQPCDTKKISNSLIQAITVFQKAVQCYNHY